MSATGADPDGVNVEAFCKEHFKALAPGAVSSELEMKSTLGCGTYGRVRLVRSRVAAEKLHDYKVEQEIIPPGGKESVSSMSFALKILKKSEIIRLKQAEHVIQERSILAEVSYPFIVNMYKTYQDERNLNMLMEWVPGGELLAQCRANDSVFKNDDAKFYAAQLVMALQYLHSEDIVYRGLVPDNILIDKTGYVKLVDFGFAKHLPGETKTYTLCGTAEYLAPEIVSSKGHSKGVDWWALGVVIYEMLAGYPPFYDETPFLIYQKILKASPNYPRHFEKTLWEGMVPETGEPDPSSANRAGLLARLLRYSPPGANGRPWPEAHRIGCLKNGAEDIKKHKWFRGLNWAHIYNRTMEYVPWVPDFSKVTSDNDDNDMDTRFFADYPDSVEESGPHLSADKNAVFAKWC